MRVLTFVFWLLALTPAIYAQMEPTGWRGPDRDGIYPEKNLLTSWPAGGPQLLWRYNELGTGYSSAAVTSDRVYIAGTTDSITYALCFDIQGKLLWKKPLGPEWMTNFPGIRSTPVIYDGMGYLVNGLGVVYCFNAGNGNVIWSRDLMKECNGTNRKWGFADNLIVDGDKIYCTPSGPEKNIMALNRKTGATIWVSEGNREGEAYSTPVLLTTGGKKFLINQPGKTYVSVDTDNGKVAWKYSKQANHNSCHRTPIVKGNSILAMDDISQGSVMLKVSNDGYGVDVVWRNTEMWSVQGEAVALDGRIYTLGKKKSICCVDWVTGTTLFSYPYPNPISILIAADNLIFSYDLFGYCCLFKPQENNLQKVGEFRLSGGSEEHCSEPVIKDGRLYIRHDNSLFVYNISDKS